MSEISGVNNSLRITGMATGLDTDNLIKQMMDAEQMKVDKVKQDKQLIVWKQEAYRDIINDVSEFKNKYFDILSDDYILSDNAFTGFDISSSTSSVASATASAEAQSGTYTVDVTQLAEKAKIQGTDLKVNNNASAAFTVGNWNNGTIDFEIGDTTKTITLDGGFTTAQQIADNINLKISEDSELNGNITASVDGGNIKFNISTTSSTIKITGGTIAGNDLSNLDDKVLNPSTSTKLSDLNAAAGGKTLNFTLNYNGVSKAIALDNSSSDKTINDLIQEINSETEGNVIARFSELTGQFVLETSSTGSASSIEITGMDADLSSAINIADNSSGQGLDAEVKINGTDVIRSTNSFTIDGISYSLNNTGSTDITIANNVDEPFEKIKGFLEDYNDMISKISEKIGEKKDYDYKPLTEAQKEDMSEDEIKKWEEQAKKGIIKNDNTLQNMLFSLRKTFYDSVDGAGIAFSKKTLGLDTSVDTTEKGKIKIMDENKLKEALRNNPEQISNLFSKLSDTDYSRDMSGSDRTTRYNEEGIFQRINDILEDTIGVKRDSDGRKGFLIEKAGIKDDATYINNVLAKQIEEKDTVIKAMNKKLYDKENRYYQMFARLEQSMNQLNAQSNWLYQQMGMA